MLIVGGDNLGPAFGYTILNSAELGYDFPAVATPAPAVILATIVESLSGDKLLIVIGENFRPGAVILVNGDERKIRDESLNTLTTLVDKKAGKKVKPGARIQVRNSDSTLSEEYIFTGS